MKIFSNNGKTKIHIEIVIRSINKGHNPCIKFCVDGLLFYVNFCELCVSGVKLALKSGVRVEDFGTDMKT